MSPSTCVTVTRRVRGGVSDAWVSRAVETTFKAAGHRGSVEVGVTLIGDAEMRRLNRKWRGHDKTTDVLSFQEPKPWPSGRGRKPFLGDILVSTAQVRRQARAAGRPWRAELAEMLVHGTLHLLDYDHLTKKDEAEMSPLQQRVMKRLKL